MTRYDFMPGPWENAERPTLVMENPTGGDPIILGEFARIYRPEELYELCRLANRAAPNPPPTREEDAKPVASVEEVARIIDPSAFLEDDEGQYTMPPRLRAGARAKARAIVALTASAARKSAATEAEQAGGEG